MGYPPAMAASDKYHGVAKFNVATGKQHKGVSLKECSLFPEHAYAGVIYYVRFAFFAFLLLCISARWVMLLCALPK